MAQVRPAPAQGRLIRNRRSAPTVTALVALLSAGPTVHADPTLSLADAERIAIQRDAVLQQLAVESDGMRQRAIAEGQLMDPRLRFGAVNVPVDSWSLTAEDMTMVEVGVSQEFPAGRTRELSRKRMEQIATASQAAAGDRRRVVQRELRRVWVELAYIAAARKELMGQEAWVEQMRSAARARYAAGEGKQLDVLQAGLDVAMLREQQLDLDRDESMRRAQLVRWLGEDDAARAGPFALPARTELPPLATLEGKLAQHPAQVDYETRIEAAQTAVQLAQQSTRPGWMLDLSYGFRGGEMDGKPRPDMVTAMVSMDLPLFRGNRQDREVAAARAEAEGLHEMHKDHQREMSAMLQEAWGVVDRTGQLERYYETDLVPLADQTVQAALLAYRNNRAMVDDVVSARRVALETNLKRLRLAADRAQAQYELDYLVGAEP
ncbi:MAG TPA: TolC family protein [Steroidobacteraceae bacterium]|nr:TolC family protein [Steroidobacteraceae bacterium]